MIYIHEKEEGFFSLQIGYQHRHVGLDERLVKELKAWMASENPRRFKNEAFEVIINKRGYWFKFYSKGKQIRSFADVIFDMKPLTLMEESIALQGQPPLP